MATELLGPIEINEPKNGSTEKSTAQVLSLPTFDSRLYPNYFRLTYPYIRDIRRDPTIQLARWCVLAPMIHTPWMYEKRKHCTSEMIQVLEDTFASLRDQFLCASVFGTLDYGWQPFEIVYKPDDGYIYIDKFKQLLVDYTTILVYRNNGGFAGFANETFGAQSSSIITSPYALNTNFEVEGTDWYGFSVFDSLFKIYEDWNTIQGSASRYDKKVAGATWVLYYPVGKTNYKGTLTNNDEIALAILNSLEASGSIAIPDDIQVWLDDSLDRELKGAWRVELISATNSASPGFIDRQKYLDALKMRAFGLTERSVLEGSHGTKAEADVHGDVSLSIVDSRHRLICAQLNVTAVPHILTLNFGKKYAYAACMKPAPLADNQFKTIKEVYSRIISDGDALAAEVASVDMKSLRDYLGIPSGVGLKIEKEEPKLPSTKVETEGVTSNG